MDNTTPAPTPTRARDAEIAAATAHLKESWEQAREAAEDARRIARRTWHDLHRGADRLVETRPWTTVFAALGTGLAVGFLTGLLVSRAGRGSSGV
jgi:ElaB/YqjD/DUF883 family membrane-anchored ribosome-binding protein